MRALGQTRLMVSAIGLGTVKLGRTAGLKLARPFVLPDDAAVDRLIGTALDLGITLFDTAPAYGESELRLGRALGRRRDQVILSSKAGEFFTDGRSSFDFSPAAIRTSVEASLRRLQTDRLDILLLHSDGIAEGLPKFGPALEELDRLKRNGLVRASGISSKTPAGAALAMDRTDLLMVSLNEREQTDRPVIADAARAGRGVLVKKALASGHAANPAQALRFALDADGVSAVLVGTIDPDHLRDLVAASA